MRLKLVSLAVLGLGAVGCGGGPGSDAIKDMDKASLASEADVRAFSQVSPINLYVLTQQFVGMTGLDEEDWPECPKVTRDGDSIRVEGGCTDDEGASYSGTIVFKADKKNSKFGKADYQEFRSTTSTECGGETVQTQLTLDGVTNSKGDDTKSEFDLNLAVSGTNLDSSDCSTSQVTAGIVYKGTTTGPVPSADALADVETMPASTWNGSGQMGISLYGYVDVETTDEVLHLSECPFGALSGQTRITGEKEAVITYRGATDCGDSATWTLDGVEQGELEGVTCSAVGGGTLSALALAALGGLLRRRRRS